MRDPARFLARMQGRCLTEYPGDRIVNINSLVGTVSTFCRG